MTVKTSILLFYIVRIWLAALPVSGQTDHDETEFVIDGFKLETLPGGYYYPNFIENLAPDAVGLIEESNGFALLDQPTRLFRGRLLDAVQLALRRFFDQLGPGRRLAGRAAPLSGHRFHGPEERNAGTARLRVSLPAAPPARTVSRFMLSTVFPNLGGYTFLGKLALGNHASLRADDLYSTRRKINGNDAARLQLRKKIAAFVPVAGPGLPQAGPPLQRFQPSRRPVRRQRRPAAAPFPLAKAIRQGDAGPEPGGQLPGA